MNDVSFRDYYPANDIVDANGVRINLPAGTNIRQLFIATEDTTDKGYHIRVCSYIRAVDGLRDAIDPDGRPIQEVDLSSGRFSMDMPEFLESIAAWYALERIGRDWASNGRIIPVIQVKQWIQAALMPFKISTQVQTDAYRQLQIRCANATKEIPAIPFLTSEQFNERPHTDPVPIVDKILYPGLTVFAAPPKTGKSFIMLDLVCCIATGRAFWGYQTKQGDAAYLDLEGSESQTVQRLRSTIHTDKLPSNVWYTVPSDDIPISDIRTLDNGLIQQLEQWITAAKNPLLIVVDTLQLIKGRAARGETAYDADSRFMRPLRDLAIKKSIAIICVTHMRKANGLDVDPKEMVHGSVAQVGVADNVWTITGRHDEKVKTFHATTRGGGETDLEIEPDANGVWHNNGTTEEQLEAARIDRYENSKIVAVIREMVAAGGGRWQTDAQEIIEVVARKTGEYPAPLPADMGKKIKDLEPELLKRDHILTIRPTSHHKGRQIVFEKQGMTAGGLADGN